LYKLKTGKIMAKSKVSKRRVIDKILIMAGVVATVALLTIGGLAWWASSFISDNVSRELKAQRIYFPPKGSEALNPEDYPGLQQYGGQQVDTGAKAKAYANEYIGKHLEETAGGKTYAEISTEARKDPTNTKLQAQKASLFQGETLRGLLLNAYAFGTMANVAQIIAYICFIAGALMGVLVFLGLGHLATISRK
jgi:hypothetical protein